MEVAKQTGKAHNASTIFKELQATGEASLFREIVNEETESSAKFGDYCKVLSLKWDICISDSVETQKTSSKSEHKD